VEFNCRFGDPETEAILPLMRSSLLDLVLAVANGDSVGGSRALEWDAAHAVTTVVAAAGYPEAPVAGTTVELPPEPSGVHAFHAGTSLGAGNSITAAGGRVLAITGVAPTLAEAAQKSREYALSVGLEGKQVRGDIGWRELARGARAS
jgi:phosphoribosylamine--glycine ligase